MDTLDGGGKSKIPSEEARRVRRPTLGEVLPDSSIVDIVRGNAEGALELLHWSGKSFSIAPDIELGGVVYEPEPLHPMVQTSTLLPRTAARYETIMGLIQAVAQLIRKFFALDEPQAIAAALWCRATWLSECFGSPSALVIKCAEMQDAISFFHLIRPFIRRPLMVQELSKKLPFALQPTLLVCGPISVKNQADWSASNQRGLFIGERDDGARDLACFKAVIAAGNALDAWGTDALRIWLPPLKSDAPMLAVSGEQEMASEFQPQFLMFRLRNLARIINSPAAIWPKDLTNSSLARQLLPLGLEEPDLVEAVSPLLVSLQREQREQSFLDAHAAIVECLWAPAHKSDPVPLSVLKARLNSLLRSRGEVLQYSSREIGWKLRQMGLMRRRVAAGKVIDFTALARKRIHELRSSFGADLPLANQCEYCQEATDQGVTLM